MTTTRVLLSTLTLAAVLAAGCSRPGDPAALQSSEAAIGAEELDVPPEVTFESEKEVAVYADEYACEAPKDEYSSLACDSVPLATELFASAKDSSWTICGPTITIHRKNPACCGLYDCTRCCTFRTVDGVTTVTCTTTCLPAGI